MHIALTPNILAPIGIIFTILATCFTFRVFWGTLGRWCRVIPESTSFIKRLWHDPFVYMLVSMMGVLLFFATPLIIISHPIPMKNFDEHVVVQGRNVTIENLPKHTPYIRHQVTLLIKFKVSTRMVNLSLMARKSNYQNLTSNI